VKGRDIGFFIGFAMIAIGILFQLMSWYAHAVNAECPCYFWETNLAIYSPWLDWGLVIYGTIIVLVVAIHTKGKKAEAYSHD